MKRIYMRPEIITRVDEWAKVHAVNAYRYSSPASYWQDALAAGFITEAEYGDGQHWYGEFWYRSGD